MKVNGHKIAINFSLSGNRGSFPALKKIMINSCLMINPLSTYIFKSERTQKYNHKTLICNLSQAQESYDKFEVRT